MNSCLCGDCCIDNRHRKCYTYLMFSMSCFSWNSLTTNVVLRLRFECRIFGTEAWFSRHRLGFFDGMHRLLQPPILIALLLLSLRVSGQIGQGVSVIGPEITSSSNSPPPMRCPLAGSSGIHATLTYSLNWK